MRAVTITVYRGDAVREERPEDTLDLLARMLVAAGFKQRVGTVGSPSRRELSKDNGTIVLQIEAIKAATE